MSASHALSASSADVLVVGAGVDGLACAAALARSGRRVALCEARARPGGLAAGEELEHGARTAGDRLAWAPPLGLLDGLELERHGLVWRAEPPPVLVVDAAGGGLLVHADPARMSAALGGVAAARYAALRAKLERWAQAVRPLLLDVPPDLGLLSGALSGRAGEDGGVAGLLARAGESLGLARKGLALRRLGARDLTELLRAAPMAARDFLEDELYDPRLATALALPALAGTTLGPRAPGTTATLLLDAFCGGPEPLGGPPALVDALVACARRHGVAMHTSTRVAEILVRDGRACGARVATGAGEVAIQAELVVSTLDVATTALELVAPASVPDALERAARAFKRRGRAAVVHLALAQPPRFPAAGGAPVERAVSTADPDVMERAADAAKHGRLAEAPWAELRVLTPPTPRAGDGAGAVVTLHLHAVPADAGDDATRAAVEAAARAILARLVPDARVLTARVKLPADLAREHGHGGGHLAGGELILDQLWIQRPALCASRYRTPLAGLWLGGSGSHPGGGMPGGAGALAARAILATE